MSDPATILTLGHSTRPLEDTLALLRAHGVAELVDVRRYPRSKRHPHYDGHRLAESLARAGIGYRHLEPLGGYREALPDSPNRGLADPARRGYADHMASAGFVAALTALRALAHQRRTAILCAEARPEHCHRALLADALLALGERVEHILDAGPPERHELSSGARVVEGAVTYPGGGAQLSLDGL